MMRRLAPFVVLLAVACGGPSDAPMGVHEDTASVEPEPLDPNAPAEEAAALADCGAVTEQGYCGVTFGMTPAEAVAKFPVKLNPFESADPQERTDPNRCFEMFPVEPVQGVSFLVEQNSIGRVDFLTESARTADGFGVGTSAADIRAKYGAAAMDAPNKYEPEITDLTITQGETKFVFEVDSGRVRAWRVGVAPTVDYVEHCG